MKISYHQMSIMVMASFLSLKLMALPGLMWEKSDNMSWLVCLVLMLVDFVYALIIVDLMQKNKNKNFAEFLRQTFGIVVAKIILFLLVCYYAISVAIIGKGLEFFIIQNLYEEFFWLEYGVPLMAVVGFMVYKGARNIARTFEFFWIPILIACVYIAVKAFAGVKLTTFLPMFKDGAKPLFETAFEYSAWFGSSTFMLMLFGDVDFKDSKKRSLVMFTLISILLVQLLYFVFYGLFGVTSPTHQFCISDVAQFNGSRSSVGELSWLVVSLWIVAQIGQFALYSYCMVKAVMMLLNIKSPIVGVLILDAYILFWGIWGTHAISPEAIFYHPIISWFSLVVAYVLPIFLVVGNSIAKRKQKKAVAYEKS